MDEFTWDGKTMNKEALSACKPSLANTKSWPHQIESRVTVLEKQVRALDKLYKNIQNTVLETGATIEEPGQYKMIGDGFGSTWSKKCPECGKNAMYVVRPGKVQCASCG